MQEMESGSWVTIDRGALLHNLRTLESVVGADRALPVLKGNAYGHGYEQVCSVLRERPKLPICVNSIDEARQVLKCANRPRIIIMGGVLPQLLQAGKLPPAIELTVGNFTLLEQLQHTEHSPPIHLKFDTGMGRQGFNMSDLPMVLEKTAANKNTIVGISSHLANVEDVLEYTYAEQQLDKFDAICAAFQERGYRFATHTASSAAALALPRSRRSYCRFGISLYGIWPSKLVQLSYFKNNPTMIHLRPALSWQTYITTVKALPANSYIGYGCSVKTMRETKIAILAAGYHDGYPRLVSRVNSYVLVQGTRCPVLGRICMNMMTIDVTHLPQVAIGDKATLIGQDGDECVNADHLSEWSDTIPYEILSRIRNSISHTLV